MFGRVKFVLLVAAALPAAGCQDHVGSSPKPGPTSQGPSAASVSSEAKPKASSSPPHDPRVDEYEAGVVAFAKEARVLAKLLPGTPSTAAYDRRLEQLREFVARMPDPVKADKLCAGWSARVDLIMLSFRAESVHLSIGDDAARLHDKSLYGQILDDINATAKELLVDIDDLERSVTDCRVPAASVVGTAAAAAGKRRDFYEGRSIAPPAPPPEPTAAEFARARERAELDEPAVEVGPDRPGEVRVAAEALTRWRRAKAVLERFPRSAGAELKKEAAADAWAKAVAELNKARTAALESAVTEAKAKADREHPVLKTGPAQDQIKSRTANDKAVKELTEAARAKVEANYDLPTRKGESPK